MFYVALKVSSKGFEFSSHELHARGYDIKNPDDMVSVHILICDLIGARNAPKGISKSPTRKDRSGPSGAGPLIIR